MTAQYPSGSALDNDLDQGILLTHRKALDHVGVLGLSDENVVTSGFCLALCQSNRPYLRIAEDRMRHRMIIDLFIVVHECVVPDDL